MEQHSLCITLMSVRRTHSRLCAVCDFADSQTLTEHALPVVRGLWGVFLHFIAGQGALASSIYRTSCRRHDGKSRPFSIRFAAPIEQSTCLIESNN